MARAAVGGVVLAATVAAALVYPVVPRSLVTASSIRGDTVDILRRLGGEPCPGDSEFTCVTVAMPLDHFTPSDDRTIDVVFAVRPADGERLGSFVTATGGPGYSGISVADYYTSGFDERIPAAFDLVFFDQRGLALSGGLTCPDTATAYYRTDAQTQTPAEERALQDAARRFTEACVAEVGPTEVLPFLGTAQAAADLDTFRQIMQDEQLWLYGESYGTQFAQTYTAAHPDRVASLILDGTVDLTRDGLTFYRGQATAFSDTLTATMRACRAERACRADLGDGLAVYDDLAAELANGPIPFEFPLARGGTASRAYSLGDLETTVAGQLYSEDDRMLLARALASAGRGDLVPMARLLYLTLGIDPQTEAVIPDPTYSDAVFYAVECQDYFYGPGTPDERAEAYLRAGDGLGSDVPRLASLFYGDLPCAYWPGATTTPARPEPLVAEDIPTLVLGATADPATPVDNGQDVFSRLDDGYLVTQRGGPHVIFGRGNACPDDLVTRFLVRGHEPGQRRTACPGSVMDGYVRIAPEDVSAFESAQDALASAEDEITYLPEYYYWDGVDPLQTACDQGGTLSASSSADGSRYLFDLDECAFTSGFAMSGRGAYDVDKDRFELHVRVGAPLRCELDYVRTGVRTRIDGRCDQLPVA